MKRQFAPYVPSPQNVVHRMLELANVSSCDTVFDLGCGDGRILLSAVNDFGAHHAIGYEVRRDIFHEALANIRRDKMGQKVTVYHDDLMNANISCATIILLYLTLWGNMQLKSKLLNEATTGTRIVSHVFPFTNWPITKQEIYCGHPLYVYVLP
jgi:16S rRNA A1518/A1519 N6-dimethyltransferase RsmA/KsgA/DIM1 with predicted DNA glycosylase/AP lyase activity